MFVVVERLQVVQQLIPKKSYLDSSQLSLAVLPNFSVLKAMLYTVIVVVVVDVTNNYCFSELYQN